jgi:hypothetical protein
VSSDNQENHDAALRTLGLLAEVSTSENLLAALG